MSLGQKEYSTGIPVESTTGIYAASIVGLIPLVTFTLLITPWQHVRAYRSTTHGHVFVEDQLFPWYLGLGICAGMCSVSKIRVLSSCSHICSPRH